MVKEIQTMALLRSSLYWGFKFIIRKFCVFCAFGCSLDETFIDLWIGNKFWSSNTGQTVVYQ